MNINNSLIKLSQDLLNQISGGKGENKERQERQEKQDRKDTMERYTDFLINYD